MGVSWTWFVCSTLTVQGDDGTNGYVVEFIQLPLVVIKCSSWDAWAIAHLMGCAIAVYFFRQQFDEICCCLNVNDQLRSWAWWVQWPLWYIRFNKVPSLHFLFSFCPILEFWIPMKISVLWKSSWTYQCGMRFLRMYEEMDVDHNICEFILISYRHQF